MYCTRMIWCARRLKTDSESKSSDRRTLRGARREAHIADFNTGGEKRTEFETGPEHTPLVGPLVGEKLRDKARCVPTILESAAGCKPLHRGQYLSS